MRYGVVVWVISCVAAWGGSIGKLFRKSISNDDQNDDQNLLATSETDTDNDANIENVARNVTWCHIFYILCALSPMKLCTLKARMYEITDKQDN